MKKILICDYSYKRYLLIYKASHSSFDYKIMSKDEFYKTALFDYSSDPIPYLLQKETYDYSDWKKLIRIIQHGDYEIKPTDEKRIAELKHSLTSYYQELEQQNLIEKDPLADYEFKNVDIFLFEADEDKEIKASLNRKGYKYKELHFADLSDVVPNPGPKSLLFSNKLDQFAYIFADIRKKILRDKVSPDSIAILVKDDADIYYCDLMADAFNIRIEKTRTKPLTTIPEIKRYLEQAFSARSFPPVEETDNEMMKNLEQLIDTYHLRTMRDFDFTYASLQEILGSQLVRETENTAGVKVSANLIFDPSLHYYVSNYTSDDFYKISDDNNIFIDAELEVLSINPSYALTKLDRRLKLNFLLFNDIAFVSRVKLHQKDKIYDSPFVNEFKNEWPKTISASINKDGLYTQAAFNLIHSMYLDDIKARPNEKYRYYDNRFNSLVSYEPKENFSISNFESYASCPFRYYLEKVININKYDTEFDDFSMRFGTFIHKIFEDIYKPDYDFEKAFKAGEKEFYEETKKRGKEVTDKEEVFLATSKNYLKTFAEVISSQKNCAHITSTAIEEPLSLDITSDKTGITYNIKGRTDKIIFSKANLSYYTIVDYKTGSTEFDLETVFLGKNLQLPLYSIALEETRPDILKDAKYAGFAIQHPYQKSPITNKDQPTSMEDYASKTKFVGLALGDVDYFHSFDETIETGENVKKLKDGQYLSVKNLFVDASSTLQGKYTYGDFLSDTKSAAIETLDNVHNGHFEISPKKYSSDDDPCSYCSYRDICYRKVSDYKDLTDEIKKHFHLQVTEESEDA